MLKNIFFRFGGIYPFSQLIEKLLLVDLSVFFTAQICVYLTNAPCETVVQTFFHGAAFQIEYKKTCKVGQLTWKSDDVCIFEIKLSQFGTLAYFYRYFTKWVVVEPQLLEIWQILNVRTELHDVVVTQIQSNEVAHFEDL